MLTVQFCSGDNETLRKHVYCTIFAGMRVIKDKNTFKSCSNCKQWHGVSTMKWTTEAL